MDIAKQIKEIEKAIRRHSTILASQSFELSAVIWQIQFHTGEEGKEKIDPNDLADLFNRTASLDHLIHKMSGISAEINSLRSKIQSLGWVLTSLRELSE